MDKEILIDRYILEDIVGEGSYSIVFRGWDQEDKKRVAIKELKSAGMTPEEADEANRLFFNEINILKDLRHSSIPRIFDFFIFEGRHYMVMEWVEGENLEERLTQKGKIPQEEALDYMKKLTNVLCYLQSTLKRIIYRDIKPSNIIVNENGNLKLIDFGISRYYSPEKKKDTHILGTPGYAPPEAYTETQTDFSADIYSLGATFYHLTTDEDPVQFNFIFPNPQKFNPQLTEYFSDLLLDCLRKKEGRIENAEELKGRLEGIGKESKLIEDTGVAKKSSPFETDIVKKTKQFEGNEGNIQVLMLFLFFLLFMIGFIYLYIVPNSGEPCCNCIFTIVFPPIFIITLIVGFRHVNWKR